MSEDSLPLSVSIGRKIKHARLLRGIGINELARRIERSPATISNLENEFRNDVSSITLALIARELRIDPAYFFRDDLESPFDVSATVGEELPDEIKEFFLSQDVLPWVQLREHCKLYDVTPDDLRAIIDAALQIKNKSDNTVKGKSE